MGFFLFLTAFLSIGRTEMNVAGGYSDAPVTDNRVVSTAEFAIKEEEKAIREINGTPSLKLTLVKIISAQQQVVAGSNFRLKLKVTINNTEKLVEAVVFQKLSDERELTSWEWK
jgi:hypothetical protein